MQSKLKAQRHVETIYTTAMGPAHSRDRGRGHQQQGDDYRTGVSHSVSSAGVRARTAGPRLGARNHSKQ